VGYSKGGKIYKRLRGKVFVGEVAKKKTLLLILGPGLGGCGRQRLGGFVRIKSFMGLPWALMGFLLKLKKRKGYSVNSRVVKSGGSGAKDQLQS
jgi:hypothetical protein